MRRRSLFAGLAGLLAAPKVAAAVPAGQALGHPAEFLLTVGEPIDITRGGFIGEDEWARSYRLLVEKQRLNAASRNWKVTPPTVRLYGRDTDVDLSMRAIAPGDGGYAELPAAPAEPAEPAAPVSAPSAPIGISWSGYTDHESRDARSVPLVAARAGGGEAPQPPAALTSPPSLNLHSPSLQWPDTTERSTRTLP